MQTAARRRSPILAAAACLLLGACELLVHKPAFDRDAASDPGDATGDRPETINFNCEGLVLLMHFDGIAANGETGTFVRDYSGAGNDGSVRGAQFNAGAGRFDGAYTFDGNGDAVVVGDSDSLDLDGAVTLAAWIYPTGETGFNYVITKATQPEGYPYIHYCFGWDGDSTNLRFVVSSETQYQITTDPMTMNRWYHVVGTFDLDAPSPNMKLYVDGAIVSSRTVSEAIVTNDQDVLIGGYEWYAGETWIGRIDEVAVFDRALTGAEVAALYASDAPIPCDRIP
jgi:hypothetical protein